MAQVDVGANEVSPSWAPRTLLAGENQTSQLVVCREILKVTFVGDKTPTVGQSQSASTLNSHQPESEHENETENEKRNANCRQSKSDKFIVFASSNVVTSGYL